MCRYAPEYNLEQTGETYAQRAVATDRYRFWRAHAAPAPSALSRGRHQPGRPGRLRFQGQRAPVVDMAGGQQTTATAQPGGSYVVKPGDTLYKIARSNNVDVENVKRWNNLSDPNQISVGQVLKLSGGGAAAGGATQVTPVASAKSSSTQPRPLDQPSDSGAATSTPSTATPAPAPTPAENRRARPMPASSTGAGRPPARSPRASTTTPRASTSPATWATPSSRRPTARSCTAATACAAWAT